MSNKNSLFVKLNAYTGYVVRIQAYGSQTWYPNITALKYLEKIQKIAVRLIFNSSTGDDYDTKLKKMKLLPLSLYIEIQDLLLPHKFLDGDDDVSTYKVIKVTETKTTRQAFRNELKLRQWVPVAYNCYIE